MNVQLIRPPFLIALFALVVAACGGTSSSAISELTATPSTLPPGGGPVEVRWKFGGAKTGTLRIDEQPQTVPAEGTRSLVITQTTRFELSVETNGKTERVEQFVTVEQLSVSGSVVDTTGAPVEGVEVRVNGADAIVTDSAGHFVASDVSVPYKVLLHAPGRNDQLWTGLTQPQVTLSVPTPYSNTLPTQYEFSVSWINGGVNAPANAELFAHLLVFSAEDSSDTFVWGTPAEGTATFRIWLKGPAARTISVVLLQGYVETWLEGNWQFERTVYQRVGRVDGIAADSATVTEIPRLALTAKESRRLSVQLEPEWVALSSAYPVVTLPGMAPLESLYGGTGSMSRTYDLPLPPVEDALVSVRVNAHSSTDVSNSRGARTRRIPVTASGPLVVSISTPPELVTPLDREQLGNRLAWTRPDPGPCKVALYVNDAIDIHTDNRELLLSDLAHAGVSVENPFDGPNFANWSVSCPEGFASIEDATADLSSYSMALDYDTTTGVARSDYAEFTIP